MGTTCSRAAGVVARHREPVGSQNPPSAPQDTSATRTSTAGAPTVSAHADDLLTRIHECNPRELQQAWAAAAAAASRVDGSGGEQLCALGCAIGDVLMRRHAEPLMAEEILHAAGKADSASKRARVLHARALAQAGAAERAVAVLEALQQHEGATHGRRASGGSRLASPAVSHEETRALLARCYKDLALRQRDEMRRVELLGKALSTYLGAFDAGSRRSEYTGINAATLAWILGDEATARALASEVISLCNAKGGAWLPGVMTAATSTPGAAAADATPSIPADGYWLLATLGEAHFITGSAGEALAYYAQALRAPGADARSVCSTKRQLQLLIDYVDLNERWLLDNCFCGPSVPAATSGTTAPSPCVQLPPRLREPLCALRDWHVDHYHASLVAHSTTPRAADTDTTPPLEGGGGHNLAVPATAAAGARLDTIAATTTASAVEASSAVSAPANDDAAAVGVQTARSSRSAHSARSTGNGIGGNACGCDHLRLALVDALFDLPRVALLLTADVHDGVLAAPGAERQLADAVARVMAKARATEAYASLASLADIVCMEAVHSRGGTLHLVLPVPLEVHRAACAARFAQHDVWSSHCPSADASAMMYCADTSAAGAGSVAAPMVAGSGAAVPPPSLMERMNALLAAAATVDIANDLTPEMSTPNAQYCSMVATGMANMRAQALGTGVERVYVTPHVLLKAATRQPDPLAARPLQLAKTDAATAYGSHPSATIVAPPLDASAHTHRHTGRRESTDGFGSAREAWATSDRDGAAGAAAVVSDSALADGSGTPLPPRERERSSSVSNRPAWHALRQSPRQQPLPSTNSARTAQSSRSVTTSSIDHHSPLLRPQAIRRSSTTGGQGLGHPRSSSRTQQAVGTARSTSRHTGDDLAMLPPPLMAPCDLCGTSPASPAPLARSLIQLGPRHSLPPLPLPSVCIRSASPATAPTNAAPPFTSDISPTVSETSPVVDTASRIDVTVADDAHAANDAHSTGAPQSVLPGAVNVGSTAAVCSHEPSPAESVSDAARITVTPSGKSPADRRASTGERGSAGEGDGSNRSAFDGGAPVSASAPPPPADGDHHLPPPTRRMSQHQQRRASMRSTVAHADSGLHALLMTTRSKQHSSRSPLRQLKPVLTAVGDRTTAAAADTVAARCMPSPRRDNFSDTGTPLAAALVAVAGATWQPPTAPMREPGHATKHSSASDSSSWSPVRRLESDLSDAWMMTSTANPRSSPGHTWSEDHDAPATSSSNDAALDRPLDRPPSPDLLLSPAAAAAIAGVPLAVEHWVAQNLPFRVLFLDSVLARGVAAECDAEGLHQVVDVPAVGSPRLLVNGDQPAAATGVALMPVSVPAGLLAGMVSKQVITAILFADVVGYSKLTELQVLVFVEKFLGAVDELLSDLPAESRPTVRSSWGDALYFCFTRVHDAGVFALLLTDLVAGARWATLGLPEGLNIRVSLHAAPVHAVIDPITKTKNYTGMHTSRAARIEPVTPPGSVYCTQAFAAMATACGVTSFASDAVGCLSLAKGYGQQPVYHVRWAPGITPAHLRRVLRACGGLAALLPRRSSSTSSMGSSDSSGGDGDRDGDEDDGEG